MVTVGGDARIREQMGAELVNRLTAETANRRCAVVVAGRAVHPDLLVHTPVHVADLADFDRRRFPGAEVCFVVCGLATPDHAALLEGLALNPAPRVIPVVVDDVVGSDWSFYALGPGCGPRATMSGLPAPIHNPIAVCCGGSCRCGY